nr:hypothetical protein [Tanacetum cinerariifolium]
VKAVVLPPTRTPSCAWAELASSRPLLRMNSARFMLKRKDGPLEEPLGFAKVASGHLSLGWLAPKFLQPFTAIPRSHSALRSSL